MFNFKINYMAAANTDKLRKKKSLFQTTLNGGISDSDTSLVLNSASGVPTDTGITIVINRVDANGNATPSAMEVVTGVLSGSTVSDLLRAQDATTAKSHANASVVEIVWDAQTWNDFVAAYLEEHGQDGKHLPAALSVPTHAASSKATPVAADEIPIVDSEASNVLKKLTIANLLKVVYPIGSIYVNATDNTNPGTLLGFGTWSAFGAGRVMVGIDAGDTDFDVAEETGGAKTVSIAHVHTTPNHQHLMGIGWDTSSGYMTGDGSGNPVYGSVTGTANKATFTHTSYASGAYREAYTQSTNGGNTGAMSANATPSIVQPYIVVHMWKRTA